MPSSDAGSAVPPPSPELFLEAATAYQRTAAVKAAVDLDLFTRICALQSAGGATAQGLAAQLGIPDRGVRILCDYLVIAGFLTKQVDRYRPTPDTALFLDRRSPACMGSVVHFMCAPSIAGGFDDLTGAVRRGGTTLSDAGTMEDQHPVWIDFAHQVAPLMRMPAELTAQLVQLPAGKRPRVLDIAASHGLYGIALARLHAGAELVFQDWPQVVEVAAQNAAAAGLGERTRTLPGDAFAVDFGGPYDVVLLPNFLHHFDQDACTTLLSKVRQALAPGGQVVIVEFVPADDRVSPPQAAAFALVMLATTARGDAYTFAEYRSMLERAGFVSCSLHALAPSAQSAVIGRTA